MTNPLLNRTARIGESGRKSEKRVARSAGARLQPASGSMIGAKGDMRKGNWLTEAKSTTAGQMALKLSWLEKINDEAMAKGLNPALTVSFVTGDGSARGTEWVLIRRADFQEITES